MRLAAFQDMNGKYQAAQSFIQDSVAQLADKGITPEQVAGKLLNINNTGSTLTRLASKGVISSTDVQLIARQQMNKLGQDSTGLWNPSTFSVNVAKAQQNSPEAMALLYGSGAPPATQSAFANLKNVADTLHEATGTAFAKANAANPDGGIVGRLLMKGARIAAFTAAAHVVGGEGSEAVGAVLGGVMGGEGKAQTVNALYRVAQQPWAARMFTKLASSPATASAYILAQSKLHPQSAADLQALANATASRQ